MYCGLRGKIFFKIIASVFLLFLVVGCETGGEDRFEETRFIMDTVVRVSVYDRGIDNAKIRRAVDRAFRIMSEIEAKTSVHVDSSEVSLIGKKAGQGFVRVSPEMFWILKKAVEVSEKSRGAFDVSLGVVKDIWGFDSESPHVPDESLVQSLLSNVDYLKILFEDGKVSLDQSGMQIDLGGIAKGYIIDRGVEILKEEGISSGIVDAGGDLRVFGTHPERTTWRIGIRHPRGEEEGLIGVMEIGEASIATSGDYERYFVEDGRRYHHILDPKTGFPAERCVSVTVVAETGLLADAYATAVFVLGPEEGMVLLKQLPSVEGMIVYEEEGRFQRIVSEGLREKIHF